MGLSGVSLTSLLLILLIILVVFGPKRLRNIGNDLGAAVKNFRQGLHDDDKPSTSNNLSHDNDDNKPSST